MTYLNFMTVKRISSLSLFKCSKKSNPSKRYIFVKSNLIYQNIIIYQTKSKINAQR